MAKRSLLLVDGDAKSLRVLEVSLKKAGFNISTAANGIDALQKAADCPPDLVISDTDLPEMDGYGFCKEFKQNTEWSTIPFIFLTKESSIENKIQGLELGVDDYLTKPIYIKEILTRVRILLQKHERAHLGTAKEQSTRFAGRLNDMGVVDLIQTIEVSRKTGVIYFRENDKRQATIFFKDGKVIDAETGHLQGAEAVYRILTWNDGEFEALFRAVRRRDVINMSSQALLMEGMRRLDEWGRLQEQLPPLDKKFEIAYEELWERLSELPDDLNSVLRLFDTRKTLSEVIDGSSMGDLEVVEIIIKLYFEGIIVEVGKAQRDAITSRNTLENQEDEGDFGPSPITDVAHDPTTDATEEEGQGYRELAVGSELDLAMAAAAAVQASDMDRHSAQIQNGVTEEEEETRRDEATDELLDKAIIAASPVVPEADSTTPKKTLIGVPVARLGLVTQSVKPQSAAAIEIPSRQIESEEVVEINDSEESFQTLEIDADFGSEEDSQVELESFSGEANPVAQNRERMEVSGLVEIPDAPVEKSTDAPPKSTAVETAAPSNVPNPDKTLPIRGKDKSKAGIPLWFVGAGVLAAGIAFYVARSSSKSDGATSTGGSQNLVAKGAAVDSQVQEASTPNVRETSSDAATTIASSPVDGGARNVEAEDGGSTVIARNVEAEDGGSTVIARNVEAEDGRSTASTREQEVQELIRSARRAKQAGERFEALQIIDESLNLRKSSTALLFKAELLLDIGDSDSAANLVDQLTRVAGRRPAVWRLKGYVSLEKGNKAQTRTAFSRYLEMAPGAKDAAVIRKILQEL